VTTVVSWHGPARKWGGVVAVACNFDRGEGELGNRDKDAFGQVPSPATGQLVDTNTTHDKIGQRSYDKHVA
jgi:hypothetical protein